MLYLERFSFPNEETEWNVCSAEKHTCYDSFYPFGVLGEKELGRVSFEPVTTFYGGNGSGKTTALNAIADAVGAQRSAPYNRTSFWQQYVSHCHARGAWQRAENVAMPIFIPESLLQKEKDHVEGFAPEVAWVTMGGSEKLEDRLCVRPTSETLFCDHFAHVLHSWRDLPMKYNQWCSVVRWEKTTRPFLRLSLIHI